jgi:hypothetical protein
MRRILDWGDTLLDYLRLSNEDERIIAFLACRVLPLLTHIADEIDWLEVGPGPGTKTLALARVMERMSNVRLRSLRLLEPAATWRAVLRQNCPTLLRIGELSEARFEEFARFDQKNRDPWHPNFITLFHVLYDPVLTKEFVRHLKRQQQTRQCMLACAIVEAERSDFFTLRAQLAPLGLVGPCPAPRLLRDSFVQAGLAAEEIEVNGQYCQVPDNEQSVEWLLSFLLGRGRKTLNTLPKSARSDGMKIIHRFFAGKNRRALEVPDVAFIIRTG